MEGNEKTKKKGGCLKFGGIALVAIIAIGIIGSVLGGNDNKPASNTPSKASTSSTQESKATTLEPYSISLSSGHYTAGIDIPAGTYNVTAVNGAGNVSSTNMYSGGMNSIMAPKADDLHIAEFKNLKLPEGETLSVSGVTIKLDSDGVDKSNISERAGNTAKEITLSDGNYTAGKDFESGTYDISWVKGSGNVASDNMFAGGLNVIIGEKEDSLHITKFENASFEKDNTLTISGVTIKLIPSK
ncbi:hypothetical protein [Faecalispora jeddahensis]|uniref:hypothetical protein n=1 Tax=Faecalispora jeddahensis TaxID=1414721 RepID=UPI0028A62901|nr:hypothetical protein [Faecalispora jeddahensis]